jgi:hypothetical protein
MEDSRIMQTLFWQCRGLLGGEDHHSLACLSVMLSIMRCCAVLRCVVQELHMSWNSEDPKLALDAEAFSSISQLQRLQSLRVDLTVCGQQALVCA